jgi:hypothetical protein
MNVSIKQLSTLFAASLLSMAVCGTANAQQMTFSKGSLEVNFDPAPWATLMARSGNAYNGVDQYGRPNEEQWQPDPTRTSRFVFDSGLMGTISGDAWRVRDAYLDDYFTAEEIAPLTTDQVVGLSARDAALSTLAFNLIYLHNHNPLVTDIAAELVPMHRLPFSEPWPKPKFAVYPYGTTPPKPANDHGGRNPQPTTATFDDADWMNTFQGAIGVGGAFRVNGRWGFISSGDMALRYDPNRPNINAGVDGSGQSLGGKEGTDGWYITAHLNPDPAKGVAGVAAFESAKTKVTVSGNKFIVTGQLVYSAAPGLWRDSAGVNGLKVAGKFKFVGNLKPTPAP